MTTATRAKSSKSKPKKPAAAAPPAPVGVDGLRKAVAAAEEKLARSSSWDPAHATRSAELARLRGELDLAELHELPAPAAVTTKFQERSITLATIVITGNHREHHDQAALERLANSLRTQTLQQRIGVRSMGDGRFELIFGSRRYHAAKIAGWEEIPAKVYAQELTPAQVEILRSIENFGRKNLTAVEEAVAIARTIDAIEETLAPLREYRLRKGLAGYPAKLMDGYVVGSGDGARLNCADWFAKDEKHLVPIGELQQDINAAGGLDAYVGQQFSRTAAWVRDHAYVAKLGGKARELLMASRITLAHARELAKLGDKDRADNIAGQAARKDNGTGGEPVEWVRARVNESLRALGRQPWELGEAFGKDVDGCTGHACSTCPYNTKTEPDLYGGSIADEPEAGFCTNQACFDAKTSIIEKRLVQLTKAARPIVKKAGAANQTTLAPLLLQKENRIIRPTSAVRRLQRDLADALPQKEGKAPAAGRQSSSKEAGEKESATLVAKNKYDKLRDKWGADAEEAILKAVDDKPMAKIAVWAITQLYSYGLSRPNWYCYQPGDEDKVEKRYQDSLKGMRNEVADPELRKLFAVLGDPEARMADLAEAINEDAFDRGLSGWCDEALLEVAMQLDVDLPAPPDREEMVAIASGAKPKELPAPTPEPAAPKAIAAPGMPAGETLSTALLPKPEKPGNQTMTWNAWAKATAAACRKLKLDVDDVLPTAFAVGLYTSGLTPIEAAGRCVELQPATSGSDSGISENRKNAGGGDFEEEPNTFAPADLGFTLAQLEGADAVGRLTSGDKMFPEISSLEWDNVRWVVLGTKQVRGHECYQLAELAKSDKTVTGGNDARAKAAAGDFNNIGVIDLAQKKTRWAIAFQPGGTHPSVIYVRATAGGAA